MLSRDDMNRSEQESLYRTSRKLSLVPMDTAASRRPSFISTYVRTQQEGNTTGEDLVLSVLKSPVNHIGTETTTEKLMMESCVFDEDDEADSDEEKRVFDDGR